MSVITEALGYTPPLQMQAAQYVRTTAEGLANEFSQSKATSPETLARYVLSVCAFAQETGDMDEPAVLGEVSDMFLEEAFAQKFGATAAVPKKFKFTTDQWTILLNRTRARVDYTRRLATDERPRTYLDVLKGVDDGRLIIRSS